ncbi:MAG: hypothetical protein ABH876_00045 [Patescibacteria group bacterium]|nr:hypothetical protein [Patescibacteria group bacterium]
MQQEEQINNLLDKIKKLEDSNKADLSSKEDLGVAVMNLISIEEHLFFTYQKTNKDNYLELLNEVRQIRKHYLAQIVKDPEGEIWCISKHLLASSMRLIEVGTKMLGDNRKKEAQDLFNNAYSLWNMFWGLNLNLLDIEDVVQNSNSDKEIILEKDKKVSLLSKVGEIVNKILDCCRE